MRSIPIAPGYLFIPQPTSRTSRRSSSPRHASSVSMAQSACSFVITNGGQRRIEFGPQPRMSRSALEGEQFQTIAKIRSALLRRLIMDEFETDHQAESAYISDLGEMRFGQSRMRSDHVSSDAGGICHQGFLSSSSMVVSAAAIDTGLPPKVEA